MLIFFLSHMAGPDEVNVDSLYFFSVVTSNLQCLFSTYTIHQSVIIIMPCTLN